MKTLINQSMVKKFALDCSKYRYHKFSRVSKDFLTAIEVAVREQVRKRVASAPSSGKTLFALALCFMVCAPAFAHPINMKILAEIESSNNPKAYNKKTEARGLYQITPIVLKQFWKTHNLDTMIPTGDYFASSPLMYLTPKTKGFDELFTGHFNRFVADWYLDWLSERCDTVDEILIAWHDGIGNLRKYQQGKRKLGTEMIGFLEKYKRLTLEKSQIL